MQEEKKKKIIKWSCIIGLIVLIAFVVITSIVINNQKQKLDDLKDKNEQVTPDSEVVIYID